MLPSSPECFLVPKLLSSSSAFLTSVRFIISLFLCSFCSGNHHNHLNKQHHHCNGSNALEPLEATMASLECYQPPLKCFLALRLLLRSKRNDLCGLWLNMLGFLKLIWLWIHSRTMTMITINHNIMFMCFFHVGGAQSK